MGWKVREWVLLLPAWADGQVVGTRIGSHDPVSNIHTDMLAVTRDVPGQKR